MVTLQAVALAVALSGANETVLLDFSAPWCEPCRMMEPTVQRLQREGYPVRQVNIEQHAELAARFRVTGVPCFIMLVDGQEVDRVVGACSHARLLQMFAAANQKVGAAASDVVRAQSPDPPPSRFSLPDRLALLDRKPEASPPTAQADTQLSPLPPQHPPQQPAPGAPSESADTRAHALQAAVRIRVDDPQGQSVGSGTVIDQHGRESLALSCAHIFRDSGGRGRIYVDLFQNGKASTTEGTLISYDLDRDVALVSFVPATKVAAARIAPAGFQFRRGDRVFSIGCDLGREPSLRESQITHLDRYLGPPNIEAAGAPTEGRSGGGLFSQEGLLIGVCNHADPADDEGIYASLPTIHWALDRVGQRRVYQPSVSQPSPAAVAASGPQTAATPNNATVEPTSRPVAESALGSGSTEALDTELICIVRSRTNPQAGEQVYVLDQPRPDLLQQLASESRQGLAARRANPAVSGPAATSGNVQRSLAPPHPIVRGQSADRP